MEHLDEGTIHAWLDGALSPEQGREIERHTGACAECAASVAEARGFIAASSRILSALDNVPGGVLPQPSGTADAESAPTDDLAVLRSKRRAGAAAAARRRPWWRHPGFAAAAAAAFVAAGSFTVIGLLPNGDDVTVAPSGTQTSSESFRTPKAAVESAAVLQDEVDQLRKAESRSASVPQARPVPERTAMARKKESVAQPADAAQPPAPSLAASATHADAPAARNEVKAVAVSPPPLGRASLVPDTASGRRSFDQESRQRGQLEAATAAGSAAAKVPADSIVGDKRAGRMLVPAAPEVPSESGADRAKARSDVRLVPPPTALLAGCYAIRLVAVGGGPMAIAAVRLPTHIALDTVRVPIRESADAQYQARDVSPDAERTTGAYRWRPTGEGSRSFDLFIIGDNGTQSFAALVGGNPTATGGGGPVTPMPAGAPVRLAATRERCR